MGVIETNVPKGTVVADVLIEFVNSYCIDSKNFAMTICRSHRTLQQSIMRLFINTIREMAKEIPDDRNAATVELAKKISELADDYPLPFI